MLLAVSFCLSTLTACGGGGGSSTPETEEEPPPAISSRVDLAGAQVVAQSPPEPSADPEAPDMLPPLDTSVGVSLNEPVQVSLEVESSDGVAAILVRLAGEEEYLEVDNPAAEEPQEETGKSAGVRRRYHIPLTLIWRTLPPVGWDCLEFAARDYQRRLSNYVPLCFEVSADIR